MAADKGKKTKLEEEVETAEDGGELVQFVEKLQEIQDDLEKINEEASDKVLEVEQRYNEIRRPVYSRRTKVIQSIPDFWLTAFLSHPALGELLTEEDQKVFKHLVSLEVEDFKDVKSGYSISFNFSANPFFEETKLTKTFSFSDEGTTNITCTSINWKDGVNISNGDAPEKKGNKRPFSDESFFTWFSDTQPKNLQEAIYDEIAEVIKEDLWPNPLKYFNNEPGEEDFDEDLWPYPLKYLINESGEEDFDGDEDDEEKGFDEDENGEQDDEDDEE